MSDASASQSDGEAGGGGARAKKATQAKRISKRVISQHKNRLLEHFSDNPVWRMKGSQTCYDKDLLDNALKDMEEGLPSMRGWPVESAKKFLDEAIKEGKSIYEKANRSGNGSAFSKLNEDDRVLYNLCHAKASTAPPAKAQAVERREEGEGMMAQVDAHGEATLLHLARGGGAEGRHGASVA